jgi:putative ABC transport system permease protein
MKRSTMVRLASRNTLRRPARTAFTAGMVTVSVALLVIALTLIRGIFGEMLAAGVGAVGEVRITTKDFVAREELMPLDANLPVIAPLVQALTQVPGVRAVEPRLAAGVTVTIGEELGDVFALAVGADERYFRERLHAKEGLIAGAWFTGAEDEIIAGDWVVGQLKAKVGDELVLLGATQDGSLSPIKGRLVGIAHGPGIDQQLLLPLARLQYLADIPEGATELLLYGDDYHLAAQLADVVAKVPEVQGLSVAPWSSREPWANVTGMVSAVQGIIVFIIGLLTALGIWNTMTMTVLERTSEIGVLRAMGMTRPRVVGLIVFEAVTISLAGGIAGAVLGAVPAWYLTKHGLHLGARTAANAGMMIAETLHGSLTASVVFSAFVLGVVMALVGSLVPALRAATIQPVEAMRSGR